jgi:hypothetical protein
MPVITANRCIALVGALVFYELANGIVGQARTTHVHGRYPNVISCLHIYYYCYCYYMCWSTILQWTIMCNMKPTRNMSTFRVVMSHSNWWGRGTGDSLVNLYESAGFLIDVSHCKSLRTIPMHSIDISSDVDIDDIAVLQHVAIWNTVTAHLDDEMYIFSFWVIKISNIVFLSYFVSDS